MDVADFTESPDGATHYLVMDGAVHWFMVIHDTMYYFDEYERYAWVVTPKNKDVKLIPK